MKRTHHIVIAAALVSSAVLAGGAIGATQLSPKQESQAVIDDVAKQLGVESAEVTSALKQALKNRVDAAVEDGRLTEEQASRMKERIDASDVPMLGVPFLRHGHGHGPGRGLRHHGFPKLETAAEFLGLTQAQLREALRGGKTLAQVARDRGKSVNGLVDALVKAAETRLNEKVESGRLTEAEKQEKLQGLRERIRELVNEGPRFHKHRRPGPALEVPS